MDRYAAAPDRRGGVSSLTHASGADWADCHWDESEHGQAAHSEVRRYAAAPSGIGHWTAGSGTQRDGTLNGGIGHPAGSDTGQRDPAPSGIGHPAGSNTGQRDRTPSGIGHPAGSDTQRDRTLDERDRTPLKPLNQVRKLC